MDRDSNYREITTEEVDAAAALIARAYIDDPLCAFTLPNRRTREKTLFKLFRALGELSAKNRRLYGVGDPLLGIAIWKRPDEEDLSVPISSLGKFLPLLFTYYPIGLYRARGIVNQTEALHARHAPGPHFYLDNLAVHPSAQGKGLASRLVRPFLEQAEAQNVPVYTDTVTRSNVAIYEHFGFTCVEEAAVPGTGVTIWALLREPGQ